MPIELFYILAILGAVLIILCLITFLLQKHGLDNAWAKEAISYLSGALFICSILVVLKLMSI